MQFPSEHALNAVFAFETSPATEDKAEISRRFLSDEISAYEYAELTGRYLKEKEAHSSDCSLHNGPATDPEPCNCGVNPRTTPTLYGSEYPA